MADNVAITPGTGATVAADDIGGILHQRVKISVGADGSATDVSSAAPMPTIETNVVTSGTVTALASAATSAQLLAANSARKGLFIINTDANAVLIKFGTTASATSFNIRLVQYAQYEMANPVYTGRIDAIWEADGSGSVYATEL